MKVLIIDPWGIKNTSNYLNGLASGVCHFADLTLATNYYFENTTGSAYRIERLFFKRSEKKRNSMIRKIIRGLEYFRGYFQVFRLINKERFDVIHINWLLNYNFDIWALKRIKKKNKVAIIYTAHNIFPHVNGYKCNKKLAIIYSLVDAIILHGNSLKEEFCRYFPKQIDKVFVQKHGSNLNPVTEFDVTRINREIIETLSRFSKICIFFGLVFYNKGIDRIMKYWIDKAPNALLIVAGKQDSNYPEYEGLKKNARLCSNILLLDQYVEDNLLNYLISKSNLVLLPYRHASMSGVVFTAADFSKTVLATDVGAIPEYLENGKDSFVVDNNDEAIFNQLAIILKQDTDFLTEMGVCLKNNINKKCNWESIGEFVVKNIYAKALERRILDGNDQLGNS